MPSRGFTIPLTSTDNRSVLRRSRAVGRRSSSFRFRRRGAGRLPPGALPLETYSDSAIVNAIRGHVDARDLPGAADWGVTPTTPTTQRLLSIGAAFGGLRARVRM